jgi:asparagine synthase (glutamine-hydrolysing)
VLRSDKCISSHGLEPRTPFLDRSWVQYYLNIEPNFRFHPGQGNCEKWLLRNAFSEQNFLNREGFPLLPYEVLWRRKEAFSDGVSKQTRSLYEIIQQHISNNFCVKAHELYDMNINLKHNEPKTLEQQYYRKIFESHYTNMANVVPYFWMPRFVEATDASARTLDLYNTQDQDQDRGQDQDQDQD